MISCTLNPTTNYQELEQTMYSTAMKTIAMYKHNPNQVYNNKNIKTAWQQKRTGKKELQQAIKSKIEIEIKLKKISTESQKKPKENCYWLWNWSNTEKIEQHNWKWRYKLQTILELSKKYEKE